MSNCERCRQKSICKIYDFAKSHVHDVAITITNCRYAVIENGNIMKKTMFNSNYADRIKTIKEIELETKKKQDDIKKIDEKCKCGQDANEECSLCHVSVCQDCAIVNPLSNSIYCEDCFAYEEE